MWHKMEMRNKLILTETYGFVPAEISRNESKLSKLLKWLRGQMQTNYEDNESCKCNRMSCKQWINICKILKNPKLFHLTNGFLQIPWNFSWNWKNQFVLISSEFNSIETFLQHFRIWCTFPWKILMIFGIFM